MWSCRCGRICSLCWQPIFGRTLEAVSVAWSNAIVRSMQRRKRASPALCPFRELSKRRRQCLLLTLSSEAKRTISLYADHDDSRKYFFRRWSKDGDFYLRGRRFLCHEKRSRLRPKEVGRYAQSGYAVRLMGDFQSAVHMLITGWRYGLKLYVRCSVKDLTSWI